MTNSACGALSSFFHSSLGIFRLPAVRHAARGLPSLRRRRRRGSALGRRQTLIDQSLHALRPRWARRLSWKETAQAFRNFLAQVFDAVEHIVTWGLEHRQLGQIDAIGVDEIQYAKGHKYLTLVYQTDIGITRLLWVGKERTIESFQGFFATMGPEIVSQIVFVCSDMWEPYLKLNGEEPFMRRRSQEPTKTTVAT
jgi:transposase